MRSSHSIVKLEVCSRPATLVHRSLDIPSIKFKDFSNETTFLRVYYFGELSVSCTASKIQIGSLRDLSTRGLYIEISNEKLIIKNDWLGSIPLFYNRTKGRVSTDFQFCVERREIDEVGLAGFLKYGYSVFGRTPIKDVEFLEYCSEIEIRGDRITVVSTRDPLLDEMKRGHSSETEIISLISQRLINAVWDKNKVLIPLSGGFDSRLLTYLIQQAIGGSKVLNVSYGYSSKQYTSYEVQIAQEVSNRLNTTFKWIELENENEKIVDWLMLKGASTHLHGMYQIDFYKKVVEEFDDISINISGIYGDLWSGKILTKTPQNIAEYEKLFLSHGLTYSEKNTIKGGGESELLFKRFARDREFLSSNFYRAVTIARHKMILLSYLVEAPQSLGIETYSPFLDLEVVSSMLRLPVDQWERREWQKRFFAENDLLIKSPLSIESRSNVLFLNSYKKFDFPTINPDNYEEKIKYRVVEMNRFLSKKSDFHFYLQYLITRFKLNRIPMIGKYFKQPLRDAVYDYYHFAPIEWSLNKYL